MSVTGSCSGQQALRAAAAAAPAAAAAAAAAASRAPHLSCPCASPPVNRLNLLTHAIHNQSSNQHTPQSTRYDALERENAALKRRVAELIKLGERRKGAGYETVDDALKISQPKAIGECVDLSAACAVLCCAVPCALCCAPLRCASPHSAVSMQQEAVPPKAPLSQPPTPTQLAPHRQTQAHPPRCAAPTQRPR